MNYKRQSITSSSHFYDVVVIGAGHAGCEAALAAAKMGSKTLLLTLNLQKIALMPCNPSIGGIGKGHLVREIDALGGQMAQVADKAAIQIKTLNSSKGPAVRALRAQADKKIYEDEMTKNVLQQQNLHLKQGLVEEIITSKGAVQGVVTSTGHIYEGKTVILAAGTFMKGRLVIGEAELAGGRMGEWPALKLSAGLKKIGLAIRRFQSATPPRVDARSINYSKMDEQPGDKGRLSFSIDNKVQIKDQISSYLTFTNAKTKNIVQKYLQFSPIKSGTLQSHGPRYCPSIDRKVINFADKTSHPVFVEPEGRNTQEMYLQGLTTAMPAVLQQEIVRTVCGLENAQIMRPGYAVEYDYMPPEQLKLSLETKQVEGLFLAGQVIGTTGYEEAAALGLMAGINAALKVKGEKPLIVDRSQGYIGVLIDDLVTKGVDEPYRMFTSRAEYRLLLRCDNAQSRLRPVGNRVGLISKDQLKSTINKEKAVKEALINTKKIKNFKIEDPEIKEMVRIELKYEGYINRQLNEIERFKRLEHLNIPNGLNYSEIKALSFEAREKLQKIKPTSLGQASRIPGITPADISILHVNLRN